MKSKEIFLIIACLLLGLIIYQIRSILPPFIISFVLAYFLSPVVDRITASKRLSRANASLLILGIFTTIFFAIMAVFMPLIYIQTGELIAALPQYFHILVLDIYPKIVSSLHVFGIKISENFMENLQNIDVASYLINFTENIFSSSVAIVNIFSLIFITPIIVFYLLKDWDSLVVHLNRHLSSSAAQDMKKIRKEIDERMAGYIRGQALVCLIVGIIYSVLLSFTGLNFGFLIGLATGILTFIPYVGALTGTTVAIIVALFQWGFDFPHIIFVILVFVFVQIIESNFLTPKLVGDRIGLHPLWVIFGLFVFGALFGFIGILFAMPLSAICGVLVKHFSQKYT